MKSIALCLALMCSPAIAQTGQIADIGTTAAGLAMGAAEANPLGIVTLGLKAAAYHQIKQAPDVEQPHLMGVFDAFGWGAAANNLCIIATLPTGIGPAVCPAIGLVAGLSIFDAGEDRRNRETFDVICRDARLNNPDLECIYR